VTRKTGVQVWGSSTLKAEPFRDHPTTGHRLQNLLSNHFVQSSLRRCEPREPPSAPFSHLISLPFHDPRSNASISPHQPTSSSSSLSARVRAIQRGLRLPSNRYSFGSCSLAGFAGISLNELVLPFAKPCLYHIASIITISRRAVSIRYHSFTLHLSQESSIRSASPPVKVSCRLGRNPRGDNRWYSS
jgi:hypothetical protein